MRQMQKQDISYTEEDLVRIAKRLNNAKRSYLVVNPLQGKHVPVSPSNALLLFDSLADLLSAEYEGERLLLIGFAETATAIGARAAVRLQSKYIQTTREQIPGVRYLFFSEEHSHATEQRLVKEDMDQALKTIDRIIFIEDEVTTGKTILNIIEVLKKQYAKPIKFAVASLLNGMSGEHREVYARNGIPMHCLLKTDHSRYAEVADTFEADGGSTSCSVKEGMEIPVILVTGWMDARRMVDGAAYEDACRRLWAGIKGKVETASKEKMLVVGTEEFMYPALYVAWQMEQMGHDVKFHATTRSPIEVSVNRQYPLHHRYELCSFYDPDRKTFLYDIDAYDRVFVITDSHIEQEEGVRSLFHALREKNNDILIVRWC